MKLKNDDAQKIFFRKLFVIVIKPSIRIFLEDTQFTQSKNDKTTFSSNLILGLFSHQTCSENWKKDILIITLQDLVRYGGLQTALPKPENFYIKLHFQTYFSMKFHNNMVTCCFL